MMTDQEKEEVTTKPCPRSKCENELYSVAIHGENSKSSFVFTADSYVSVKQFLGSLGVTYDRPVWEGSMRTNPNLAKASDATVINGLLSDSSKYFEMFIGALLNGNGHSIVNGSAAAG